MRCEQGEASTRQMRQAYNTNYHLGEPGVNADNIKKNLKYECVFWTDLTQYRFQRSLAHTVMELPQEGLLSIELKKIRFS